MSIINATQWQVFLQQFPYASYHQSSAWGELKACFGWEKPLYVCTGKAGAQVLFYKLPMGINFAYIPKGPLGTHWQELWEEIDVICRNNDIAFLKVEPDVIEPITDDFLREMIGFNKSRDNLLSYNSMYIDLEGNEKDWFARISRNNRQYIRRAVERGVVVCESDNVEILYRFLKITADRRHFGLRSLDYYQKAYDVFVKRGNSAMFIVEHNGEPLAAYMFFGNGSRFFAVHAGSVFDKNNLGPNYLAYWETMKWAAAHGYKIYDLMSIVNDKRMVDDKNSALKMGGIYHFKRRFGAKLVRSIGAWDRVYHPLHYRNYKIIKNTMDLLDNLVIENILYKAIKIVKNR